MISACQEQEDIKNINTFDEQFRSLSKINFEAVDFGTTQFGSNLTIINGQTYIDSRTLFSKTSEFINGKLFLGNSFSKETIESLSENFTSFLKNNDGNKQLLNVISSNKHLSEDQIVLLEPFIEKVLSNNFIDDYMLHVNDFNLQIEKSNLELERKYELLAISASIFVISDFLLNGGIETIQNQLGYSDIPNGRVHRCRVNTRNVFGAAVISAFATGGVGAYVGATAGSFTVPILGTAAGAVGGGVFGFASGFVTGAVLGVAAELLLTCAR